MGKFNEHEQAEFTKVAVMNAISSFDDLRKRLHSDYMECIRLAKQLGNYQKDQNFEKFMKKFAPNQNDIDALSKEMDERMKYVRDRILKIGEDYWREGDSI